MVIKNLCVLVIWTKGASTLEGLVSLLVFHYLIKMFITAIFPFCLVMKCIVISLLLILLSLVSRTLQRFIVKKYCIVYSIVLFTLLYCFLYCFLSLMFQDPPEVHSCGYSGRKFILKKYYNAAEHGPSITYEEYLSQE